jgi:hypothetical protein
VSSSADRHRSVRLRLARIGDRVTRAGTCPACGHRELRVHARTTRRVGEFPPRRVNVVAYQCRRCGHVHRRYPPGVDINGRSVAARQVAEALRCLGYTYRAAAARMAELGLPIAPATVRALVTARPIHTGRARRLARDGRDVSIAIETDAHGARWLVLRPSRTADDRTTLSPELRACLRDATNDS